ncbi:MAG: 4'-phosphopantetheinyl transferase superfamily protein [Corynebacterium sp.]|nr:4'-phosphopantetheinyl transferase superfamily protein [Corynebacterium sp.]
MSKIANRTVNVGSGPDLFSDLNLFPESAVFAYIHTNNSTDLTHFQRLHPLEQALVSHAVDVRKAEFGDARYCAHQALRVLGRDTGAPILRGERGMPLWPAAVSGSLTHTRGFRGAVLAPGLLIRSMGIDCEVSEPLPEGVLPSIARDAELPEIEKLRGWGINAPEKVLFCAKEATYKSWFPITHRWLGFEHAEIHFSPDGTFRSHLLIRPTPVPFIEGRWAEQGGYVLASTFITK